MMKSEQSLQQNTQQVSRTSHFTIGRKQKEEKISSSTYCTTPRINQGCKYTTYTKRHAKAKTTLTKVPRNGQQKGQNDENH
jgi:hypothetical protein